MAALTTIAFGGVIFAYSQKTPELAVIISFASVVSNYTARANIITS
jgi:hypothetical protein